MSISILESVESLLTADGTRREDLYLKYEVTRHVWRASLHADKGHDKILRKRLLSDALKKASEIGLVLKRESKKC